MIIDRKMAAALAASLLLSGCASNMLFEEPGDASFGEANRQTMMAQVVDPDPVYEEGLVTSGDHAADAIDRYRADGVKQPERVTTTDSSTGPN